MSTLAHSTPQRVYIWNRKLSAEERKALYTALYNGETPSPLPPGAAAIPYAEDSNEITGA